MQVMLSLKSRLQEACRLDSIDIFTGDKLSLQNEELFFLFSFLSAAYRQGHLFVEITEQAISPEIVSIFQPKEECENPLTDEEWKALSAAIKKGFFSNPQHELIVQEGSRLYFQKIFHFERIICREYTRLKTAEPLTELVLEKFEHQVKEACCQNKLLPEQAEAILYAASKTVALIFGGPGTGKTYTAAKFLQFFIHACPEDERNSLRIAISGPTGKATANLEKSLRRSLGADFEKISSFVEAHTLHSLLSIRRYTTERKGAITLPYQLVLVDEASMVDIHLMQELLSRLQTGTRLIFLGDPHQLPAVEAGDVFAEFVEREKKHFFPKNPPGKLSHCMRTELKDILELSDYVNRGSVERAFQFLEDKKGVVTFHEIDDTTYEPQEFFTKKLAQLFYEFEKILTEKDPELILRASTKLKLLSPLQDGVFGIKESNAYLHALAKKHNLAFVPIIISQNDYELSLMNGEMGILNSGDGFAYFEEKEGKGIRKIPAVLLSHFEIAYCLSIHKSQGSEFDKVVLFLPKGTEFFGRKCLYTAITRARHEIEIFSSFSILKECIEREGKRLQAIFPHTI
jgi:exodeoxyribonuclease V alpha subunit